MNTEKQQLIQRSIPAFVQLVAIVFFAGFAISTSIVAMSEHLWAGIGLALVYAYLWMQMPILSGKTNIDDVVKSLRPAEGQPNTSGNRSFDAYRSDLLNRLEQEQTNFNTFLGRLREAKDKSEFDQFMDDRAAQARLTRQAQDAPA